MLWYLLIRYVMNLMVWLTVMKKGIPLTNINSADKVTDWFLFMGCLGILAYISSWLLVVIMITWDVSERKNNHLETAPDHAKKCRR